jgi:hypothetical protein
MQPDIASGQAVEAWHTERGRAREPPAPIPLGRLPRLGLGLASAREMRASVPNQP